jgi:hypothetical protein
MNGICPFDSELFSILLLGRGFKVVVSIQGAKMFHGASLVNCALPTFNDYGFLSPDMEIDKSLIA